VVVGIVAELMIGSNFRCMLAFAWCHS
jgi:hypothetical protein